MLKRTSAMEILAFSADHVRRLTGLSSTQLRYWDDTEFFAPEYADGARAFGRVYSFRDVVGLRTIAVLRNERRISLQELRKVGATLRQHAQTPWSSLSLYVVGKGIFFRDPGSGAVLTASKGRQRAFEMDLESVARDVERDASALRQRRTDELGKIAKNRYVMHNAPVVAGTRIPTAAVWNLSAAGYTTAQIIAEYPRLTAADVVEALSFEKRLRDRRKRAS